MFLNTFLTKGFCRFQQAVQGVHGTEELRTPILKISAKRVDIRAHLKRAV